MLNIFNGLHVSIKETVNQSGWSLVGMIKLRIDVDYAYPSRFKGFVYTALNTKKPHKDYLKNSKIIAKMVNESPLEVMAYWFFTPYTIPDQELLSTLNPARHEVALHVATKPLKELERLEKATGRKVKYYTIHGTARLLARIIWHRKLSQAVVPIPEGFPLQSFYVYPTLGLDVLAHTHSIEETVMQAQDAIAKGEVLHIHPEWLLQRGRFNHRGPYFEILKRLLQIEN
jgi:hypothetical protein